MFPVPRKHDEGIVDSPKGSLYVGVLGLSADLDAN